MSSLREAVKVMGAQAAYDEKAKTLLAYKPILANILVRSVEEFYGMEPSGVEKLIEGEPYVGCVSVEEGFTNTEEKHEENGILVRGLNTENKVNNEGVAFFDVLFYVNTPDGRRKIIINVEAQQKEPEAYDVEMRGIFYAAREISSQKERDFVGSKYNDIKKVYSIWICMNTKEQTLNHIHLANKNLLGVSRWKANYELLNVVIIRLTKELVDRTQENELHRLLGAIFLPSVDEEEKLAIMEEEYHMDVSDRIREEMQSMCNLSQGIFESGFEEGRKKDKEEYSRALKLLTEKDCDTVEKLVEQGISKETAEMVVEAMLALA